MPVCRRLVSEAHVVDAWLELRALIYLHAKVVRKRPEPSLVKTFVVGLYCGAAHHDVAFVGNGGIVRLFDFDACMCALARLFFPDENVVRQFGIQAESAGARGRWLLALSPLCRTPIGSGCTSTQVCLATMEAKQIRAIRRSCSGACRNILLRRTAPTGAFREGGVVRRERGV